MLYPRLYRLLLLIIKATCVLSEQKSLTLNTKPSAISLLLIAISNFLESSFSLFFLFFKYLLPKSPIPPPFQGGLPTIKSNFISLNRMLNSVSSLKKSDSKKFSLIKQGNLNSAIAGGSK